MSVKLICKPEFFHRRLNSQLGLNVAVEPGTTYFLCSGLEEVPGLVSSQNSASLTALSGEKKVQILICKERPDDIKTSLQTDAKFGTDSTTSVPEESILSKTTSPLKEKKSSDVGRVKPSSTCTVTSTSDQDAGNREETNPWPSAGQSKVEAPVIKLPLYTLSNLSPQSPVVSKSTSIHMPFTSIHNPMQGGSVTANAEKSSNLPCQALRHELKQAILQRRMIQGKTMIDLMKEENQRQEAAQNMKMSEEEIEKMIKRRVSNNRAARKCREKRKLEEESLTQEVKRLSERKNALNAIISTLEQQQQFLRLWATGSEVDDSVSNEKLRSILNSEVKIPELPPRTEFKMEEDLSNSIIISSSEYNSDDTRNGFEFDSSQDTNDTADSVAVGYTEMTVEEINSIVSDNFGSTKANLVEKDERNFGEIHIKSEDVQNNSDNDSDVELIEIDRPLIIDVN
ncbi:uncharacterized protein LOC128559496 [Mercenaria mercenaria]|uniref:uncharacterized protein LOC128559496 n=1 Tax=Mercenaria mercenaria TaxID=6596 RepID=UPI00234E48B4|nr:uncharacterized protein LOC128559496 [Mercenaria mercenaria]